MITASQVAQWGIDIKYFRDQLESLRAERDTLRELVREAFERGHIVGLSNQWIERAEKALEQP